MSPPAPSSGSLLLVDESFRVEDEGFVEALRALAQPKLLAGFVERWKRDPRPWARRQIFAYLDKPLDRPGHQVVVKRLYKHAEATNDLELLAAFATLFDRIIRRVRKQRRIWDRKSRQTYSVELLVTARDTMPTKLERERFHPMTGKRFTEHIQVTPKMRLFSHATRHYLRRRVWRHFRRLGWKWPEAYPAAVAGILKRYRDEDLSQGEHILDSPTLLHACFHGCDALVFGIPHAALREGTSLSDLRPAPYHPKTWETPTAARVLLDLVSQARARLVQTWAIEMFRAVSAKVTIEITVEELFAFFEHPEAEVQQFGAELLKAKGGLENLPLATWLRLLQTTNSTALATLSEAFAKHVSPERLSLSQTLSLACAKPTPVARLGFTFLQKRSLAKAEIPTLFALAEAACPSLAGEIATWALGHLGSTEAYQTDTVCRFFDSLVRETRDAAWSWLLTPGSAGENDPTLWSRLVESPFDDIRLRLVDQLELKADAAPADALVPVWTAVLLGVHRGGRQKPKAIRQIADAIAADPARADALLPVLSVAVRSIRGPEMRAGLAAVMSVVVRRPELVGAVRKHLPEMDFDTGKDPAA